MRFLMIAGAATLLLLPAAAPANACGAKHSAQAAAADLFRRDQEAGEEEGGEKEEGKGGVYARGADEVNARARLSAAFSGPSPRSSP